MSKPYPRLLVEDVIDSGIVGSKKFISSAPERLKLLI